tara:strand:- start:1519 stop:2472 length:954 start_codon:yes stop_codon:yes gene_type:complete
METIAILTGGDSAEESISIQSAETVLKYLDKNKYIGYIVTLKNNKYTVKDIELNIQDFSFVLANTKITFDKVLIALHGPPAENGLIQNYFDEINIPYTSCDANVSAITFNKYKCNNKLKKCGFKTANSVLINLDKNQTKKNIQNNINLPFFVKPNQCGSSYGISKVNHKNEFNDAVHLAQKYDTDIIIEESLNGVEVSCGVFKNDKKIIPLPITEIVSHNDFFDYEAKYLGKSDEITPARISKEIYSKVQNITKEIYSKMNLSGFCRIDYIIQKDIPYVIEINTIPGLSENSIIPKQLAYANIKLKDFFTLCLNNIN